MVTHMPLTLRRQKIRTWQDKRHFTPFCPNMTIPKFLNKTRETSLLTALLLSQLEMSSNMENSSHRVSLLLICIPLSMQLDAGIKIVLNKRIAKEIYQSF